VFWKEAILELESQGRNLALWAKVFAQNEGNEPAAKAAYITARKEQLEHAHILLKAEEAKKAAEIRIEEAKRFLENAGYTITAANESSETSVVSGEQLISLAESVRKRSKPPHLRRSR